MISLRRFGKGLQVQFLFLAALGFVCSQAQLEFAKEYLLEIKADAAIELAAGEYDYDNQGSDWEGTCQNGTNQSPIDLIFSEAEVKPIEAIKFQNYDDPLETPLLLVNNGHTANLVLPANRNGRRATMSGGHLPGVFEAQSFHLHWGSANSKGSEHAINFERFDAEIHVVHKNTKYSSVAEASQYPDGLAVLGVMLRAAPRLNLLQTGIHRVFNALPQVIQAQSNATITGRISVNQLLGNVRTNEFYSYSGSLTTPDCAESVSWTVFSDIVSFPQSQISKLWNLRDSRRRQLINNYRDLQNINDRTVYYRPRR